jgi:hypothetical protein
MLVRSLTGPKGWTMRPRDFFKRVSGGAVAWQLVARAQQALLPMIAFLKSASADPWANYVVGFRARLNETGYVGGQNVTIEFRWPRAITIGCPGWQISSGSAKDNLTLVALAAKRRYQFAGDTRKWRIVVYKMPWNELVTFEHFQKFIRRDCKIAESQ